ncbi:MAG TPA: hypothetical protein VJ925_13275 [Longimicrobiales bacterium]|nr:hypothetical protein [Longimicrobiales bacterium]
MPQFFSWTISSSLALVLLLAPMRVSAQIAVLPRIGSAGIGGDVSLALTDRLGLRAGIGFVPVEIEDVEIDDLSYDLTTPDFFATAGLDLTVVGPLRVMGGLLFRSGDFEYETTNTGTITIGDVQYTESGRLFGEWQNSSTAPFLGVGLGGVTGGGFGLFLDAGVAFTGEPEITASVEGDLAGVPGVQAEVEKERQRINDDIPGYAELWPFLQLGVKIGIGN